ncbi:NAD-dependent succinate-semialdehyde dehydrogenase [Primorskyibacter aestuariivivens]|uniref:NAD-dependent succinate-semialdehyde dehydrogenase n=1 Tax=Primorskyibacter aestuariivivens TaxID=1888912 RepID=UPI0022FFC554|nr:NAD-dependent succinate-semialdehyde dehydrogenase [Primorskyibacter aestuariivivens]MDA7430917.1 NAD-dependent succinate-semialdehyde dehydrogenase [Primorskyibacter aestuariivivens]
MLNLKDPSLLETRAYICGHWVKTCDTFEVHNPASGNLIANVTDVSVDDVSLAIDAAFEAQKAWARQTSKERAAILKRWHELIVENVDDLARILTAEMGKPLSEARGEVLYGASFIEWFAEEAKRVYGDVIPGHQRDKRLMVLKQPVGVVGSITPWNFPVAMIARKVAPALAVGCSFVARPSEFTPLSALALAVLGERAGLPKAVFSVVPSLDAPAIGKELCHNSKVAKLTFTGSTKVGKILLGQCAQTVKRVSLELGGNAPFIVFNDADIDAAVDGAVAAKFRNAGQTCVCANRIYVQSKAYEEFCEKFATKVEALGVGDGLLEGISIGPLINDAATNKVREHIEDAIKLGARVLTGGKSHELGGNFFEPTVLVEVPAEARVSKEETFGPLAPIIRFEDEREVVELSNDTDFGLAAYFYSSDTHRVWRLIEDLETGMVGVNTGLISTEVSPFGGVKQSGLGREGSKYGIDEYLEIKSVCLGVI